MNILNRFLVISALAALAAGCGQKKAEQFTALPFPDVVPPAMMEDASDRAEYVALHYWDALTDPERDYPCDSVLVSGVKQSDVEQKFADWVQVLDMVQMPHARKSVARLCEKVIVCERKDTSSNVFEVITSLAEKYLYDPNSPLRNEDHYGAYAEVLASFEGIDAEIRAKYGRQARMCSLNRVGTKAADFRFADRYGRIRSLHGIEAPMILLFFSNPGCEACMNIINVLKGDNVIGRMIEAGELAVLNIYIDEDIEAWRSYMPVYPEQWYNGFDPDFVIRNETLYDVRAIPSLYLLDGDKMVMMKDAPEQKVFAFLENLVY